MNLFNAFKRSQDTLNLYKQAEDEHNQDVASAKQRGLVPYLRTAIDFPWEAEAKRREIVQRQVRQDLANRQQRLAGSGFAPPATRPSATPTFTPTAMPRPTPLPTLSPMATPQPRLASPTPMPSYAPPQGAVPHPMPTPASTGNPAYAGYLQAVKNPQANRVAIPPDLQPGISQAAKKHNIPPEFLAGLAYMESNFRARNQDGGGGGRGYFQIDRNYHPDVSDQQANDPTFAAEFAANLLDEGLRYGGTPENALRYYNAGPYKAKKSAVKQRANAYARKASNIFRQYTFQ